MHHMPQPTEFHKKLTAMVGEWKGEETLHPNAWSPEGSKTTSKLVARLAFGGFFVVSDYMQYRDGQVTFEGHGIYGYDTFQNKFTMHWFDSMGVDPGGPAMGVWEGNRLVFQSSHPLGHGRYTYEFSPERYTFRLENSKDGQNWCNFMDGVYRKA